MTSTEKAKRIIFEIDNSKNIQEFILEDGFLLWLHIRYAVFIHLENKFNPIQKEGNVRNGNEGISYSSLLLIYFKTLILRNPFFVNFAKYNSLVFSTSMGSIKFNHTKYTLSRVNYCFQISPKTYNFYFSEKGKVFKKFQSPYAYADSFKHISGLLTKIFPSKIKPEETNKVKTFKIYLKKILNKYLSNNELNALENELNNFIKNYNNLKNTYLVFFRKANIKYLVVENANYGGSYVSQLIFCANIMGIKTVEVQHGVLDIAYQYGRELIKAPFFSNHKTSYLLTFGKYWNQQIESTTVGFDIGNAFLENVRNELSIKFDKTILFISQGDITKDLIDIAINIDRKFSDDFNIFYCLHPNEESNKNIYINYFRYSKIQIRSSSEFYPTLANCTFVVGSYSAALFDALYFNKTIFVHKNEYSDEFIPLQMGNRFENTSELIKLIQNHNFDNSFSHVDQIWTYNWKSRFQQFINENL